MKYFLIATTLLSFPFASSSADWQRRDVRYSEFINPKKVETVHLGDGFTAWRDADTIVVEIPGAYLDTLAGSSSFPLPLQLAAAAVLKTCDTGEKSAQAVFDHLYRGSKEVQNRPTETAKEYSFEIRQGRQINVFISLNDISGLVAVLHKPD